MTVELDFNIEKLDAGNNKFCSKNPVEQQSTWSCFQTDCIKHSEIESFLAHCIFCKNGVCYLFSKLCRSDWSLKLKTHLPTPFSIYGVRGGGKTSCDGLANKKDTFWCKQTYHWGSRWWSNGWPACLPPDDPSSNPAESAVFIR